MKRKIQIVDNIWTNCYIIWMDLGDYWLVELKDTLLVKNTDYNSFFIVKAPDYEL